MSRLIDADDFKKFLQSLCKAGAPHEEVVQLLDKQPTAFDTEKVVEQLKEAETDISSLGHYAVYADDAIKIVLKGGTTD